MHVIRISPVPPDDNVSDVGLMVQGELLTFTEAIVTVFVPVFFNVTLMYWPVVPPVDKNSTFVIVTEDDPMNPMVRAPIQAATAMLTATVTAMSMIEATTGLRAFLLFSIFIFLLIPPFWVIVYLREG